MAQRNKFLTSLSGPRPTAQAVEESQYAPPPLPVEHDERPARVASVSSEVPVAEGVTKRQPALVPTPTVIHRDVDGLTRHVALQTLRRLVSAGHIGKSEANQTFQEWTKQDELARAKTDFLEWWINSAKDQPRADSLVESLATEGTRRMALCDVATNGSAPKAFYDQNGRVQSLVRAMRTPIINAVEQGRFLVIAGWNPIAVRETAKVVEVLSAESGGVIPFVSTMRLTFQDWKTCLEQHFGKDNE